MIFGMFNSESSATDNRVQASDNAIVFRGSNNTQTDAGGLSVSGNRARFTSPNSVMLGDRSGNSTTTYKVDKGNVTINEGVGADTLRSLLGDVSQANGAQISALTDAIASRQNAQASGNPAGVVAADQQAAASANTKPGLGLGWLWIVGLLAIAGLAAWKFLKK